MLRPMPDLTRARGETSAQRVRALFARTELALGARDDLWTEGLDGKAVGLRRLDADTLEILHTRVRPGSDGPSRLGASVTLHRLGAIQGTAVQREEGGLLRLWRHSLPKGVDGAFQGWQLNEFLQRRRPVGRPGHTGDAIVFSMRYASPMYDGRRPAGETAGYEVSRAEAWSPEIRQRLQVGVCDGRIRWRHESAGRDAKGNV